MHAPCLEMSARTETPYPSSVSPPCTHMHTHTLKLLSTCTHTTGGSMVCLIRKTAVACGLGIVIQVSMYVLESLCG